MRKEEEVGKTLPEIVGVLVRCYNYGSGFYNEPGFYDNLNALFEHFGYVYDESSETQGGLVLSNAAANKAAEEGERKLFEEWAKPLGYPMLFSMGRYFGDTWYAHRAWMARASRQVANKAEVKPVAHLRWWARQIDEGHGNIGHEEGYEVCEKGEMSDDGLPAFPVFATPPATTGASTVLTDERAAFEWWALNESGKFAWLRFIDGCYTTTEAQLLWEGWKAAREVAAQAGQVAVPGWISVDDGLPDFAIQVLGYSTARNLVSTCYRYKSDDRGWASSVLYSDEITHWMPLPPSPAKESK